MANITKEYSILVPERVNEYREGYFRAWVDFELPEGYFATEEAATAHAVSEPSIGLFMIMPVYLKGN